MKKGPVGGGQCSEPPLCRTCGVQVMSSGTGSWAEHSGASIGCCRHTHSFKNVFIFHLFCKKRKSLATVKTAKK